MFPVISGLFFVANAVNAVAWNEALVLLPFTGGVFAFACLRYWMQNRKKAPAPGASAAPRRGGAGRGKGKRPDLRVIQGGKAAADLTDAEDVARKRAMQEFLTEEEENAGMSKRLQ